MSPTVDPISFRSLAEQFERQRDSERASGGTVVEDAIARALEATGWRGAGPGVVEELALEAAPIVEACVTGHRDVRRAVADLAALMRGYAPPHSDALAPAVAFVPAAEAALRIYAGGGTSSDASPERWSP